VLCFDASRLARNGRDWHHLLELCGLVEARVIDLDGVYDPCRPNDRLLLGMKGSISEFELGVLRARMLHRSPWKAAPMRTRTCGRAASIRCLAMMPMARTSSAWIHTVDREHGSYHLRISPPSYIDTILSAVFGFAECHLRLWVMANFASADRGHLRSAALADAVPRGLGNTAAGRFLREHDRIISGHLEHAGIEITELTRILSTRLGRIALQIAEFERRLDRDGKLCETELRIYTNLCSQYTGIIRELVLHRHKHRRGSSPDQVSGDAVDRPSLGDILAEMPD